MADAVYEPSHPFVDAGLRVARLSRGAHARVRRLGHRTSLWVGLTLGAAAALGPALVLAEAGRIAVLKVGVAVVLTLVPGWLYAVYLERRGPSLYDEFVLNLFRLGVDDSANLPMPPRHTTYYAPWRARHDEVTTATTDNLYRRRFEGIYGRLAVSTRADFDPTTRISRIETFSPVVLATVVVGIGWTLTLRPELVVQLRVLDAVQLSGQPIVPVQALQFAFLGSYAFVLQDLVRRYFVVDLRNTAYVSAIARIIFVSLVVTAVYGIRQVVTPEDLAMAFGLGFVPRAALQAVQARTLKPLGRALQGGRREHALAEIDGLDIWQETRLVELGIENVQQFATADLVEVLLRTRTPVERLVDWLDQAFLLLLLPGDAAARRAALQRLAACGIRFATDLERAVTSAAATSTELAQASGLHVSGLRTAVASLGHQRNYGHVVAFRSHCAGRARPSAAV